MDETHDEPRSVSRTEHSDRAPQLGELGRKIGCELYTFAILAIRRIGKPGVVREVLPILLEQLGYTELAQMIEILDVVRDRQSPEIVHDRESPKTDEVGRLKKEKKT